MARAVKLHEMTIKVGVSVDKKDGSATVMLEMSHPDLDISTALIAANHLLGKLRQRSANPGEMH